MKKVRNEDVVLARDVRDTWEELLEECFDQGRLEGAEMFDRGDGFLVVTCDGDRLRMTVPPGGWRIR